MAEIIINEISRNYTYNIGTNSFAKVALPITGCWGPCYVDPKSLSDEFEREDVLDKTSWITFPATQAGLESFVATFRGPTANYRLTQDFSYQMAMTLLTAGYDILVCRLSAGSKATGAVAAKQPTTGTVMPSLEGHDVVTGSKVILDSLYVSFTEVTAKYTGTGGASEVIPPSDYVVGTAVKEVGGALKTVTTLQFKKNVSQCSVKGSVGQPLIINAKYPGTFGNSIQVNLKKCVSYRAETKAYDFHYWNAIVYIVDASGVKTAVENLKFVLEPEHATDNVLHIDEIESNFISISAEGVSDNWEVQEWACSLGQGTDCGTFTMTDAIDLAKERFAYVGYDQQAIANNAYISALSEMSSKVSENTANKIGYKEWLYTNALYVYDLLTDKLAYNPSRIISPGWDDINLCEIKDVDTYIDKLNFISPIHIKLMEVGYYSRCGTAMLDIPKCLARKNVYDDNNNDPGYAQRLARYVPTNTAGDVNGSLYQTHSALFAPWGQFMYVGTSRMHPASPAFQELMMKRSMILNQTLQYEWALPTSRVHNVKLGKLDYHVNSKYLKLWQKLEGVGVNTIADIPGLGITSWGNSTLYEVPPATYQALANLSTRYIVNAVEDVVFKCGVSITFQYNNEQAYNKFYAGLQPILDTMKNVGAITDAYVKMSADINGLDQVNANTVIGKVYLVIPGVINDIYVDLIALPPQTDLEQYKA